MALKSPAVLGEQLRPAAVAIFLRPFGTGVRNGEQADLRMIGGGDVFFGVVGRVEVHLHVRLAGANPQFAEQHVGQRDSVIAGGVFDDDLVRAARGVAGSLTVQRPSGPAWVAMALSSSLTMIFSSGSAVPQSGFSTSRWSSRWLEKIEGRRTSARAEEATRQRVEKQERGARGDAFHLVSAR